MTRRAVLVAPKGRGETTKSQQAAVSALDMIERAGFELIGIIDPKDHLEALRMIVDGRADIVVTTRPDHLPAVRQVIDEAWFKTWVMYPSAYPEAVPSEVVRRPQRVMRAEEPDWRDRAPDHEPKSSQAVPTPVPAERPVSADHRRPQVIDRDEADGSEPGIPHQRRTQIIRRGDAAVELDDGGRVSTRHRRPRRIDRSVRE